MTWIVYLASHCGCTPITRPPTSQMYLLPSWNFQLTKIFKLFSRGLTFNHVTLNSIKTQASSVVPCDYVYSLFLNDVKIELFKSIKILGVTLDWHLSNKKHISDQLKKGYPKASALRRMRLFLPHDAMINLNKAFILPHLDYNRLR